jgi:hypothetical protein
LKHFRFAAYLVIMRKLLLAAVLLAAFQMAVVADPKDNGKGKGKGKDRGAAVYHIPDTDLRVVTEYYQGRSLPPGLQKKLRRQGTLPPGWQKKMQPVPVAIEQRLAPVPEGCRRGILDGAYVVYEPSRGVIIDVVASFGR